MDLNKIYSKDDIKELSTNDIKKKRNLRDKILFIILSVVVIAQTVLSTGNL